MAIILNPDVIIRGEKGTFDLRGWLTLHATEEIEIAAITVAELWHGWNAPAPSIARDDRLIWKRSSRPSR